MRREIGLLTTERPRQREANGRTDKQTVNIIGTIRTTVYVEGDRDRDREGDTVDCNRNNSIDSIAKVILIPSYTNAPWTVAETFWSMHRLLPMYFYNGEDTYRIQIRVKWRLKKLNQRTSILFYHYIYHLYKNWESIINIIWFFCPEEVSTSL